MEFRKRLAADILGEINEMIRNNPLDDHTLAEDSSDHGNASTEGDAGRDNKGTLMLGVTCAPQYIAFPQNINLLNEARENLEPIIDWICNDYDKAKPCTYRKNARKDYLALAKRKKHPVKVTRKVIRKQLQYIRRDLGYIAWYLKEGAELSTKQEERLGVIR